MSDSGSNVSEKNAGNLWKVYGILILLGGVGAGLVFIAYVLSLNGFSTTGLVFSMLRDSGFALMVSSVLGFAFEKGTRDRFVGMAKESHDEIEKLAQMNQDDIRKLALKDQEEIKSLATDKVIDVYMTQQLGRESWLAIHELISKKGAYHEEHHLSISIDSVTAPIAKGNNCVNVTVETSYIVKNRLPAETPHNISHKFIVTQDGESAELECLIINGKRRDVSSPKTSTAKGAGFDLEYLLELKPAGQDESTAHVTTRSRLVLNPPYGLVFTMTYPTRNFYLNISSHSKDLKFDVDILHPPDSGELSGPDKLTGSNNYSWQYHGFLFPGNGVSISWYKDTEIGTTAEGSA